jgi:hypothetical protein
VVGIVTFHEFSIYHSMMELCLFRFLRIDESNDIFVPIFASSSPANQTFPCHNVSLPISIADISWILDVEIYKITFSIKNNDILVDTVHKKIN